VFEVKDVLLKNYKNLSTDKFNPKNKFILCIGRFTRQKNFILLVNAFSDIIKIYPNYRLIILGEGEEEIIIKKIINDNNLEDKVYLEGRVENVYPYFNIADCFLLTSLWEDPGFVLIESALLNTIIISSDCPTGPKEILDEGKHGYLFRSNNKDDLLRVFSEYLNDNLQNIYRKKVNLKKNINKFSIFKHYISLNKILNR
jgi:glycosyltransferase involved in cell wall biosynthesis